MCRIAQFLHCPPSEVMALPASDFDILTRYWAEEPWGSHRDNMHAAIIATEIRRTMRPKKPIDIDQFFVVNPERRRARNLAGFMGSLKAMAGDKPKPMSQVKTRKRKRRK